MGTIRIAIAGVGNCASSLIQGIAYYRDKSPQEAIGLMHWDMGGYKPYDKEGNDLYPCRQSTAW